MIAPKPVAEACWRDWRRRESERLAREERLRQRVFAGTAEGTAPSGLENLEPSGEGQVSDSSHWQPILRDGAVFEDWFSERLKKPRLASRSKDGRVEK
ncbi:unnamed protein product [Phytophthora fragariaefolia]|uniref:Unnamed protein product n=1 Tax=Phytophthora fragariaefolia TaxID=1490495 RepID=A0A9W6WR23_9STRA|nr:unnamed protein product [Phytophthora fragariaefolia]